MTSGIRVGTPAATTRGLGVDDMVTVAKCLRMTAQEFDTKADEVRAMVAEICKKYPLYE